MSSTTHWESVYRGRASADLGWYEPRPSTLDLVLSHSEPSDAVIDVGGGDSRLVDELLDRRYQEITVLDLSETALDRARSRLGSAGGTVDWVCADVTQWRPRRRWDLWHDRAVFHFLVDDGGRQAYKAAALRSSSIRGKLVIATFAPDGPEQCAGLPVQRYGVDELAAVFAPEFVLLEHRHFQAGPTDVGDTRPYIGIALERA